MASVLQTRATLDDLYRTPEKAELIGGRIVPLMSTGRKPNRVAFRIARSLDDHAAQIGVGEAYTDNMGYEIPILPSGRESFSPDASYHKGPFPLNPMDLSAAPQASRPTYAAKMIMGRRQTRSLLRNVPTTSRPGPRSFGTSIRWMNASMCTVRATRIIRSLFAKAKPPTPNRASLAGV